MHQTPLTSGGAAGQQARMARPRVEWPAPPPPARGAGPDLEGLASLQCQLMRNYFRLVLAHEALSRRVVRPSAAGVAMRQLEAERARLAHELHAGAGQSLAGIKIHLELIDAALPDPPLPVRKSLHNIGLLAQDALQQLRSISQRLHPPDWQRLTIAEAIEKLWRISGVPQRFDAALCLVPPPREPSHAARIVLYRAAQEALANIVRHSGAKRVRLTLEPVRNGVRLAVEDDGGGFDTAKPLSELSEGIGLRSMRDQVAALKGEFDVQSGRGGTILRITLPLSEEP